VQDVTFGNQTYKVYQRSSSGYIAFVAVTNFTSGTVNLLDMMNWTIARGWLSRTSTVNQICFGVEMVSTDDADARFEVLAFSIDAKLKPKGGDVSIRADGPMQSISQPPDELTLPSGYRVKRQSRAHRGFRYWRFAARDPASHWPPEKIKSTKSAIS
jgi:hypothetical protein